MARRPTKAAANPFCQARLQAAEYNEKFFSKEYAAELLHISAGQLQDYELGITKCIPPDNILRMADIYNAPELRNLYCREMCPLGQGLPEVELHGLERISLQALASFRKIESAKDSLLDITQDGVISEDEKGELREIIGIMDEITKVSQNLKVWAEKNLAG